MSHTHTTNDTANTENAESAWRTSHEVNHTLQERRTDRPLDPRTTLRSLAQQQITVDHGAVRDDFGDRLHFPVVSSIERPHTIVRRSIYNDVRAAGTTSGAQRGAAFSVFRDLVVIKFLAVET